MADGSRSKVLSLDAARAERLYVILMDLLETYCMEEADSTELERALDRFFGGGCDLAKVPPPVQDEFLDWYAFNYRTEATGVTMLEVFGEEHQRLTGQSVLPGLFESRIGFYTVEEQKGYRHTLVDRLTGERFVLNLEGEPPALKGSLLCGRIIPVGEVWRPGFTLETIPPDFFDSFQPLLQAELDRMRLAFPQAGWPELLRERWPLLRDLMLMRTEHEPLRVFVPELPPAPVASGESIPRAMDVAFALQGFHQRLGLAMEDAERLVRFWYDAAARLQPGIRKPELWAAGAAWAFYAWVDEVPLTHEEIAAEFGVSTSALREKGRQILTALGADRGDDRYVDPLGFLPRMKRLSRTFGPEAMDSLYSDD